MDHLSELCRRQKLCFKQCQVNQLRPQYWPEFGTEALWNRVCNNPEIMAYIPRSWKAKTAQRNFLWGVVATVKPEYAEQMILDFTAQREARRDVRAEPPPEDMDIDEDWAHLLLQHNYKSSKSSSLLY